MECLDCGSHNVESVKIPDGAVTVDVPRAALERLADRWILSRDPGNPEPWIAPVEVPEAVELPEAIEPVLVLPGQLRMWQLKRDDDVTQVEPKAGGGAA